MNMIAEIDKLNSSFVVQKKLSPQLIKKLTQSVLITSSGASTRIEGSKLSDREVDDLYKKLRIKKFRTRDEQEVAGYLKLLQLVFSSYKNISFSEGVILQFHQMLLQYSEKDKGHHGKYKFGPNRVEARDMEGNLVEIIFDPTEPALVPIEMKELIDRTKEQFIKKTFHPLLIIGNFIFEFLAIHPFQDGNGRMSRILTNLLLLKHHYAFMPFVSHEKIIEDNKIEYYQALNKTQRTWKTDEENIGPWMIFFLEVIKKQGQRAVKLIEDEDIDMRLSDKQKKVRECIVRNPGVSRQTIVAETDIATRTVNQVLSKLIIMNQIKKKGQGRAVRYHAI